MQIDLPKVQALIRLLKEQSGLGLHCLMKQSVPLPRMFMIFGELTLKAPITTAADDIHKYFFVVFQRK